MDDKYIKDIYDNLGGESVFGNYNDYYSLITSDDSYIKDVYDSKGESVFGLYDDFVSLVKKKDDSVVSTSQEGVTESTTKEEEQTILSDASGVTVDTPTLDYYKPNKVDLQGVNEYLVSMGLDEVITPEKADTSIGDNNQYENIRNYFSKRNEPVDLNDRGVLESINKGLISDEDLILAGYKDPEVISTIKRQPTQEEIFNAKQKIYSRKTKTSDELDFAISQFKLDKPYIYEEKSSEDLSFIEYNYNSEDLSEANVNIKDFDGFLNEKGLKQDFINKAKTFESTYGSIYDLDLAKEMELSRMLDLYISEQSKRDIKQQKLQYEKEQGIDPDLTDDKYSFKLSDQNVSIPKINEYYKKNYPKLTEKLLETDSKNRDLYKKYLEGDFGNLDFLKEFGDQGYEGFETRLQNLSASFTDLIGFSNTAQGIRFQIEQEKLVDGDNLSYSYVGGKKVNIDGKNYIVDSNNQVYDADLKIRVTNYIDEDLRNNIIDKSVQFGTEDFSISSKGMAFETSNIVGDMAVQIGLQGSFTSGGKIVSAISNTDKVRRVLGYVPSSFKQLTKGLTIDRGIASSILAQSTLGASSGYEDTLLAAKEAGLSDKESVELARDASIQMAKLYALTAPISPQTKATEAIFGKIKNETIKDAIKAYRDIGKKGFIDTFEKVGRKATTYFEEGLKEAAQENIQQSGETLVVNKRTNELAGVKLKEDEVTVDSFINTSLLSLTSGFLMPFGGDLIGGARSKSKKLLGIDGVDRIKALRLLSENQEKLEKLLKVQQNKGIYSESQVAELLGDVRVYKDNVSKIPSDLKSDTALDVISDLESIRKLENKKKSLDPSFHEDIDKEISDIRESIKQKTKEDAVQDGGQDGGQDGEQVVIDDVSKGYSFEYESEQDIPNELKPIDPISKSEVEVNGVKKIRLTFSGQQLLDAGLGKPTAKEVEADTDTDQADTEGAITPEESSNYANLTEDAEGNFVFFHIGDRGYDTIERNSGKTSATSKEEAAALSKVGGLAMYYTGPKDSETQVSGDTKYAVKVPASKVYDFNTDPLGFIEEARARHKQENPNSAFDPNSQVAYVTKIAGENGFEMVVSQWAGKTRAQTTKEFKPNDTQELKGNEITKPFSEEYTSNLDLGFESIIPETRDEKLSALYDKINNERNLEQRYDDLYSLREDYIKKSQDEITELIEGSDLSQEIKDEYKEILEFKEEKRRSVDRKNDSVFTDKTEMPNAPKGVFLDIEMVSGKEGRKMSEQEVLDALPFDTVEVDNDGKNLRIKIPRELSSKDMMSLMKATEQEAIGQVVDGMGVLYAQNEEFRKDYGDKFNPDFFKLPREGKTKVIDDGVSKLREMFKSPSQRKQVDNALNALSKIAPDVEVILHESEQAYAEATGETGRKQKTAGTYDETIVDGKVKKVIHINPDKANARTVAHEAFHAIFLNIVKSDAEAQRLAAAMIKAVYKSAPAELKKLIDNFAESKNADGSNNYDSAVQNEEKLAELIGYLATEYDSLQKPTKNVIKRFLDRLAKMFGMKPFTDNEVIDVLNTIAGKVARGEAVTQEDLSSIQSNAKYVSQDEAKLWGTVPERKQVRTKPDPKKTVKAYKMFRVNKSKPGKLFPLFVNANDEVLMNTWLDAEVGELTKDGKVKSKIGNLAYRPGWHMGDLPIATHIGDKYNFEKGEVDKSLKKPTARSANHVWAEVEVAADVNWQEEANKRAKKTKAGKIIPRTAHITDRLPEDGYYRYKTNPNMTGEWLIGGSIKVTKLLTDDEVKAINDEAGVADLPRVKELDLKSIGFDRDTDVDLKVTPAPTDSKGNLKTPSKKSQNNLKKRKQNIIDGVKDQVVSGEIVSTSLPNKDDVHSSKEYVVGISSLEEMASTDNRAKDQYIKISKEAASYGISKTKNVNNFEDAKQVISEFKEVVKSNLKWLYDSVDKDVRDISKLWYDGANKISNDLANQYGYTTEQVAGVMAVLSPQMDWFRNLSLGERVIDIYKNNQDSLFDEKMIEFVNTKTTGTGKNKKPLFKNKEEIISRVKNKKLSELSSKDQSYFIRVYDEVYNSRNYNNITPNGEINGLVRTKNGNPGKVGWGDFSTIEKAISILNDGSVKNISKNLGNQHKVRNFFNNISNPNDKNAVTIDTHAVAAALLKPLSGKSKQVAYNFGGSSSVSTGMTGTYPVYADAYRELANELGILPREVQSITWEAGRGLFKAAFKSNKSNEQKIDNIWNKYNSGDISLKEAQSKIEKLAGGISTPVWYEYLADNNIESLDQNSAALDQSNLDEEPITRSRKQVNLAPNGKPSNLNQEQYDIVRTPKFKNWFGDWENDPENSSKVVDENGEPLVVYHGSVADFDVFDKKKLGSLTNTEISKAGFFFASKKASADQYVFIGGLQNPYLENKLTEARAFFLNIKNPYNGTNKEWNDLLNWASDGSRKYDSPTALKKANKEFKESLLEDKFDGVDFDNGLEIVAFEPTQAKLADGSNTTFDPDAPSIRKQAPGRPSIGEIVRKGKDNMISDAAIRQFAKEEGYSIPSVNRAIEAYNEERRIEGQKGEKMFTGKNVVFKFLDKARRHLLSSKGFMPKSMHVGKEVMDGAIEANLKQATQTLKDMQRFINNFKGDEDTLIQNLNKYMRGDETVDVLPDKLQPIAFAMRTHIDSLSKQLIESGAVSDIKFDDLKPKQKEELIQRYGTEEDARKNYRSLQENILGNIGTYMTRSYEVFDNKDYKPTDEVMLAAENKLRKIYLDKATEIAEKENNTVSEVLDRIVTKKIESILTPEGASDFLTGSKLGSKKTSILKQKLDIPSEIRALMGEYTDPALNYARSIQKMSALVANQKFLNKMKEAGEGVFFFTEKDIENNPKLMKEFNTKIAAETSETMNPLSGMYTTKEIAKAMTNSPLISIDNPIVEGAYDIWLKSVGVVKYSKTILSPATHAKNIVGNLTFMAYNGYISPKDYADAYKVIMTDLRNLPKEKQRAKLQEYIKAGIINQSATLGDIRAMFDSKDSVEDMLIKRMNDPKQSLVTKAGKGLKKIGKAAEAAYQAEDDFFKIVAYENEKKRYAKAFFNKEFNDLTASEAKEVTDYVSEIVKNILPNYSRIGELGKIMKAIPVAGTFISFQIEAMRTAYNTVDLAFTELKDPKTRSIGAKRLTGIMAVIGLKAAVFGAFGLFGDEEDELVSKARNVLPPWAKNSNIIITDSGKGKFSYINASASDPHGFLDKAIIGYTRGDSFGDSMASALSELVGPFFQKDILFNSLTNILENNDEYAREIWNEKDSPNEITKKIVSRLWKTIEPGGVTSVKKVIGSETPFNEVIGQMTGFKVWEVDVEKQSMYKSKNIKERSSLAGKDYSKALFEFKDGKIKQKELDKRYEEANRRYKEIISESIDIYQTGLIFGVPPEVLKERMSGTGKLGKAEIESISKGIVPDKSRDREVSDYTKMLRKRSRKK